MQENDLIFCRAKGEKWLFLPGGHVEDGESAEVALKRELCEEIGDYKYSEFNFIGVCENIFSLDDNNLQHEINIVFSAKVNGTIKISSRERHLEFVKMPKGEIVNIQMLPTSLKAGLIEWINDKKFFYKGLSC
ncbi:MAG: NUDIX domain-containing protein [Patescibacteria group bacterium]|nr:NUDIX domain-containing protein [Patescibacteria group bacterium]